MAFDTALAQRVRAMLSGVAEVEEKKIFGGLAFMIHGKMTLTIGKDRIMVRINPARRGELLRRKGAHAVVMNRREYRNYTYIDKSVLSRKQDLSFWVGCALDSHESRAEIAGVTHG